MRMLLAATLIPLAISAQVFPPPRMKDPGANGVMARTALNVSAARTITGTANEITVSNGDGVSGNPTLSLAGTFDVSGKTSTKPAKSGTSLPGACAVGEQYFKTNAAAGYNLYFCTASDTWTLQGTGAVSTSATVFRAAVCQDTTATTGFNLGASSIPAPTCVTGTNTRFGVLQFPDSDGDIAVQSTLRLPPAWTASVFLDVRWKASASSTTGNVVWQIALACAADGQAVDPAWDTAQPMTADATKADTSLNDVAQMTLSMPAACVPESELFFKLFRNRTHASDTYNSTPQFVSLRFTLSRTP